MWVFLQVVFRGRIEFEQCLLSIGVGFCRLLVVEGGCWGWLLVVAGER
ncbi:hypothetical protein HanRHA438_Chr10g0438101 [Helianthus annuus]|uniref:Uncharacterized protein n=1 Tax=Helianthus annuus TaxID=4232 RepID=A0A9K3HV94_HELAN|nr:hypothetical protein HanXRQr2_Chr10g0425441 [Helianthus annuus]KAJ0528881.1 hypothetical protein HanHA89_Chr10g0371351 [Helianthus annuus]KAJ0695797.1 hypothetical protein HanLR1_Chr10g0349581 [Helianthus annuus]KAJ0699286.1 hypothetical protein HanOQP8_Chr10g0354131 [Helianthus annuus]KAJ0878295.1 hypothetical protein HanRHA438_Chr10g0438101 [Helianthus annuus]